MSALSRSPWLVAGALVLLALAGVSVVGENEQAVISRMGEPERVINRFRPDGANAHSGAGVALHIPLFEQVTLLPRGLATLTSTGQQAITADQQTLVLDTAVTARVIDPVRLASTRASGDRIAAEVDAWLPGLLKDELRKRSAADIQQVGSGGAAQQLRDALDTRLRNAGIQVIDVRLTRVALPTGARNDVLQAMIQRRGDVVDEERNRGAREVQLITSQAEAEAAALLEASAGKDPEFYDFYRAMRSYEAMFADPERKDKATIVLPPDSGYLKQFNAG